MKRRISLTIDPKTARKGKQVARRKKMSLSALVENLLDGATEDSRPARSKAAFSKRWSGKLRLAPKHESRFEKLAAKYNLK